MSRPAMTVTERESFLAEPRVAVLSDGQRPPLTTPVFYNYEPGGNISFFTGTMGRTARKTRLIQRTGTLSLCVQHDEFPYKYVTVEGTVIQADQPPGAEQFLAIARRYMPEADAKGFVEAELANPGPGLIVFTIRPDRWLTADTTPEES